MSLAVLSEKEQKALKKHGHFRYLELAFYGKDYPRKPPESVTIECTKCMAVVVELIGGREQDEPEEPEVKPSSRLCTHGITFDEEKAKGLSSRTVRKRWPRLNGPCPLGCGFSGSYYVSWAHVRAGEW